MTCSLCRRSTGSWHVFGVCKACIRRLIREEKRRKVKK